MRIAGGNGGDGRGRVVTRDGHHGNRTEPREPLDFRRERTDFRAGKHYFFKMFAREAYRFQNPRREVFRVRVEHLRGRCNGVFAGGLAREHIGERIGHEEDFRSAFQCRVALASHGVELEERIEVHQFDARDVVERFGAENALEIVVFGLERVRVAIGQRIAQQCAVGADAGEVHAPRVDADALDVEAAPGRKLQAVEDFAVERENVPIDVSSRLNEMVVEARQLLHVHHSVGKRPDDGSPARGTEVDGEEVLLISHFISQFDHLSSKKPFFSKAVSQRRSGRS